MPVNEDMPPIVVSVSVADEANRPRAEAAAKKLIEGLAQVLQKLEAADPDRTIRFAGRTYRVGDILVDLNNTDFKVTDRTDFQNNGVGASTRNIDGGFHSDVINMNAIFNYYGNPPYPNNSGLVSLILHELGHISMAGYLFFTLGYELWWAEPADKRGDYNNSAYFTNNEKLANDFITSASTELGLTYAFLPVPGPGAVEPAAIFEQHRTEWGF
jgi:hypothetical protein